MTQDKEAQMLAFKRQMDAEPCSGCYTDAFPFAPITEAHVRCRDCGTGMPSGYAHTCITGWRYHLCGQCNERLRDRL